MDGNNKSAPASTKFSGQIVRNYFSATGGLVTFFAPWNEAFDRIPEQIERRLLRDRIWLEQILKLLTFHLVHKTIV